MRCKFSPITSAPQGVAATTCHARNCILPRVWRSPRGPSSPSVSLRARAETNLARPKPLAHQGPESRWWDTTAPRASPRCLSAHRSRDLPPHPSYPPLIDLIRARPDRHTPQHRILLLNRPSLPLPPLPPPPLPLPHPPFPRSPSSTSRHRYQVIFTLGIPTPLTPQTRAPPDRAVHTIDYS